MVLAVVEEMAREDVGKETAEVDAWMVRQVASRGRGTPAAVAVLAVVMVGMVAASAQAAEDTWGGVAAVQATAAAAGMTVSAGRAMVGWRKALQVAETEERAHKGRR